METQIFGAVIGFFLGLFICAVLGPGGHYEPPNYWVWDRPGSIGCLGQILILAVTSGGGFLLGGFFA